jgi:hypothetical protein
LKNQPYRRRFAERRLPSIGDLGAQRDGVERRANWNASSENKKDCGLLQIFSQAGALGQVGRRFSGTNSPPNLFWPERWFRRFTISNVRRAVYDSRSATVKHLFVTVVVASLVVMSSISGAAAATPHPVTMSCKEFLSLDEITRPRVIYWAEGVNRTGRPEDAVIDIGSINRLVPIVTEQCREQPTASFWDKLKTSWDKLEASVKAHL